MGEPGIGRKPFDVIAHLEVLHRRLVEIDANLRTARGEVEQLPSGDRTDRCEVVRLDEYFHTAADRVGGILSDLDRVISVMMKAHR